MSIQMLGRKTQGWGMMTSLGSKAFKNNKKGENKNIIVLTNLRKRESQNACHER